MTESDVLHGLSSAQYLEDMKESATMNDDELSSRPRKMKYNSIFMCQVELLMMTVLVSGRKLLCNVPPSPSTPPKIRNKDDCQHFENDQNSQKVKRTEIC